MDKIKKAHIRKVRELLRKKKFRDSEGLIVAEGIKIVEDALIRKKKVVSVLVSARVMGSPAVRRIIELCIEGKKELWRVPAAEFEQLSSLNSSQGVLAIVEKPATPELVPGRINVLCDSIQDPGNLGTLIRTSAAFGVSSVLLAGENADVYNPKVVRSSSGAVLDMPVINVKENSIDMLKEKGCRIMASSCRQPGIKDMYQIELPDNPVILVFGNEGKGISRHILESSDEIFHIPVSPKIGSLNVTAAAAIAVHHFSQKLK